VRIAAGTLLVMALSRAAVAEEAPRLADDQWAYRPGGPLALDGGLVMTPPATLGTGLATGVGAGVTYGGSAAVGLRASWGTSTESSLVWIVQHDDYRLRATGTVQRAVGRGVFALRLGVGATIVHESRTRIQAGRAMVMAGDLMSSATEALPAGELEAVVSVHVAGPWLLVISGGPAGVVSDGTLHGGWTSQLGVGWRP
jgi:hypothetical protein